MLKVEFRGSYYVHLAELLESLPALKERIEDLVQLFRRNPNDSRLDNHELIRRMKGKWTFSITGDIRIVYRWTGKNTVEFLAIGGHKKVYGKKK